MPALGTTGQLSCTRPRTALRFALRPVATAPAPPAALAVIVHDMSFVERRSEETRRICSGFFVALGAIGGADHRRHRAAVVARLGAWHARPAAGRGAAGPVAAHRRAGAATDRARPARADPRSRGRARAARRRARRLDAGDAARDPAQRAARERRSSWSPTASPTSTCARGEASASSAPRAASSPRSSRSCAPARARGSPTAAARPTGTWSTGTTACRSRPEQPGVPAPPGLAHPGGGSGLLLRLRERRAVAAVPHRARAPDVPHGGLGSVPRA